MVFDSMRSQLNNRKYDKNYVEQKITGNYFH